MKKTLLANLPAGTPEAVHRVAAGADIYDSSCSPEARVYFIDRLGGVYLKCAAAGALEKEFRMTEYFHSKGLGAEVIEYISDGSDWLLTAAVAGEDCVHESYMSEPERLCDTIAAELRRLHETDFTGCPIPERTAEYLAAAESNYGSGNYDKSAFPDNFGYSSAEEAHTVLEAGKGALTGRVLLHGDYCLPNIVLKNWKLSGYVDLGCGGVGDRHIDLFWGAWTLLFNFKTDKYRGRFFDAYGRDKLDEPLLEVVAAAEVFG